MVVSGHLPKSHSVQRRMLLASDSEPRQAGKKRRNETRTVLSTKSFAAYLPMEVRQFVLKTKGLFILLIL